jgi:hypothetical protein
MYYTALSVSGSKMADDESGSMADWMNITTHGDFEGKTIKSISNNPRWDVKAGASIVDFEFTDGTIGEVLIFVRGKRPISNDERIHSA